MKIIFNTIVLVFILVAGEVWAAGGGEVPRVLSYPEYPPAPAYQSWDKANLKSLGCQTCHTDTDQKTMQTKIAVKWYDPVL